jgi:sulfur-carrier protein
MISGARRASVAIRSAGRMPAGAITSTSVSVIKIPPVLRSSVGGAKTVEGSGGNVGEVLRSLAEQHPATESQLFSENGDLNRYVNVYLNDEDVRVLDGLDTSVTEGDTIVILPAMAGGA